jgi:hypothetical protein
MHILRCNNCNEDIQELKSGTGHNFVIKTVSGMCFQLKLSSMHNESISEKLHICLTCVGHELSQSPVQVWMTSEK